MLDFPFCPKAPKLKILSSLGGCARLAKGAIPCLMAVVMLLSASHAKANGVAQEGLRLAVLDAENVREELASPADVDYELLETAPSLGNLGSHVPLGAVSPDTLRTFVSVVDLVRTKYAGSVDDETLFRNAMSGMLSQLDGHAEFLDEQAFRNLQAFTEGSVAHVGLTVQFDVTEGQWVVNAVARQSSAEMMGIRQGDYVYQIGDKKLTESHTENDVIQLLSGIAGTQLDVVVSEAGRNKRTVKLQRTTQSEEKLDVMVYDEIAIVKLPIFTDRTRSDLTEALARVSEPIRGMILDVRNNPGGVLSSAISVASLFNADTPVVQIVEKEDKVVQTLSTANHAVLDAMPVIVLQNRYSASAAEILAQALKADKEAVVVGETSYGKGSIQSIIPLGNNEAIKLTTAHYITPTGEAIDGVGVKPDVVIDYKNPDWFEAVHKLMQDYKLPAGVIISLPADY
ncbi:MAG: S41 family peptidase [Moraxella sp.]|nr:S41 family peptidase [Moraxella sp.]